MTHQDALQQQWTKEEALEVIDMLESLVASGLSTDRICQYIISERTYYLNLFQNKDDMDIFCNQANASSIVKQINFYF